MPDPAPRPRRWAFPTPNWPRPGNGRSGHPQVAPGGGHLAHLQAGGHLRRGIRGLHALLLFHLRTGERDPGQRPSKGSRKVIILGGGPNRIGQGIEFDYCCVHASYALREMGVESIMVNSNPETVSTDYDTSDRLYFEPLTFEDVLNIVETGTARGGHRPVRRPDAAEPGRAPDARRRADPGHQPGQHRPGRGSGALPGPAPKAGLRQPANGTAMTPDEAIVIAGRIGYPVVVRPSYVIGGRAMEIVFDEAQLRSYFTEAAQVCPGAPDPHRQIPAARHRGGRGRSQRRQDTLWPGSWSTSRKPGSTPATRPASCPRTPWTPGDHRRDPSPDRGPGRELGVIGLMNIQYAVKDGTSTSWRSTPGPRAPRPL
jgi:carbamoyl-phosphate synthase large subunit